MEFASSSASKARTPDPDSGRFTESSAHLLPLRGSNCIRGDAAYIERVKEAQLRINLPNVMCVDAKGLPLKEEDNLHLPFMQQHYLGLMLADAYLKDFVAEVCEIHRYYKYNVAA
ncbi:hypothetical protein SAY86_031722 [Trapa natans]|uniref:Sialate O-acetylesterase domain-containing protein n=1 Tax=Trapa natans TaxID=22666 RepID=A0AAN7LUP5_TRANT|nr:hypothetical protein SAY86_031722 [Trapa natans]